MTQLTPCILSALLLTSSTVTLADETPAKDTQTTVTADANTFSYPSDESRQLMEAEQEAAFNRYIETLKNYPPAKQLPEDVQQRRTQMINQMQEQHAMMLKMRKQHQAEYEKRRNQQLMKMQRI